MNSEMIVLKSALALMCLWVFVYYFWRDYRTDAFREHVFSLRDRLFLYAAEGGIGFDHPAYTILRDRMNIVLQYAHEFTLPRMLLAIFYHVPGKNRELQKWEGAVRAVPSAETQQKLKEYNTTLAIAILQLIVYRSFFLYLVARPTVGLIQHWVHADYPREVLKKSPEVISRVEQLESEAIEEARRDHPKIEVMA
jgi:hypothetical protein